MQLPRPLTLFALSLAACGGAAPALDGGSDAALVSDAGPDAPRPPRLDAGFVLADLGPCTLEPSLGFAEERFASYAWLEASEPLALRAFYPLLLLAAEGGLDDPSGLATARRAGATTAAACAGERACVRAALAWSAPDATAAAEAVRDELEVRGALAGVATALRGAGVCERFDDPDDGALVVACVGDALVQTTAALDAAVLDELDSATLDVLVDTLAAEAGSLPFWGPSLELATRGLGAAGRDEAVRYEPLAAGENAAALAAIPGLAFADFPYVAIVVPGLGPGDAETALTEGGRNRCDLAYDRWAAGLAPLVLVSGGHVHPDRTRFSEAIEMKRYLVTERGMPESAVLVDPYARHTTTNLRNATRILARAGVPADRPILVTTDLLQSAYIRSTTFATRCEMELGYRPWGGLMEVSVQDSCVLPSALSMHVDARDPLDP